ncbi:RDD family protein [Paractinoplanes durhamensis]|uniref:RDD family protein n=1 Tax=Paractinoplanes durhamensis TaxID=113563 RepID=UPI001EF3A9DC|nr:RDD family protein [Actinoplanes durhamensis]
MSSPSTVDSGTGLVTAEAVALDLRPARLGSRAIALMLDILLQAVVCLFLLGILGSIVPALPYGTVDGALREAMFTILVVVVLLAYPTIVETMTNGRSPGKAAMGLRVIREDGGPIRARHAFTRALVGLAVEWPGLLLPLVTWAGSLAVMIASDQGRRLGDLAAGTLVIHERRPAPFRFVPGTPVDLAPWAATADLSAIDDALAGSIGQFLSRAREIREPYRGSLDRMLYAEVLARVTPPPPPLAPSWLVLSAVLAERRRRSTAQLVAGRIITDRLLPGYGQMRLPHHPSRPAVRPAAPAD